jgi:phage gp29-like protein
MKFWLQNLQVASSSSPIVQHPVGANKETKAEALAIAKQIRSGCFGRIPENFKIIWAEAQQGARNAETYQNFIRTVDDQIAKAYNGQTLTSESGSDSGKGTQALGTVHQATQNARDVFRAHGLESTLNQTLIPWLVDFNFANVDGYPKFRFDLEDPEDLLQEAEIVSKLSSAGYEIPDEELSAKFNYTITKKQPLELKPAEKPEGPMPEEKIKEVVEEFAEKQERKTERFFDRVTSMFSKQQPHIEVKSPEINIAPAAINVHSPAITVTTPDIQFSAPPIEIHQAPIHIDVHLPESKGKYKIERDKDGKLLGMEKE